MLKRTDEHLYLKASFGLVGIRTADMQIPLQQVQDTCTGCALKRTQKITPSQQMFLHIWCTCIMNLTPFCFKCIALVLPSPFQWWPILGEKDSSSADQPRSVGALPLRLFCLPLWLWFNLRWVLFIYGFGTSAFDPSWGLNPWGEDPLRTSWIQLEAGHIQRPNWITTHRFNNP